MYMFRQTFLILALLTSCISLVQAQAYHPFPGGGDGVFAFQQPSLMDTWLIPAHFDSVAVEGPDSAFYLYRIDRLPLPSDTTCTGAPLPAVNAQLFVVDQDHPLGQKMLDHGNGSYTLVSTAGDTAHLQVLTPVGGTWAWNSAVTASVDSVTLGTVLGQPDSLKHFHLSTGEQWILSKANGLVRCTSLLPWPLFSGGSTQLEFELWGLPHLGLGGRLPGYADIFQFDPGDRFGFRSIDDFVPGSNTVYSQYDILSQFSGSQFEYETTYEEMAVAQPWQAPGYTTYTAPRTDTLIYQAASFQELTYLPYQHQPVIPSFFGATVQTGVHFGSDFSGRIQVELSFVAGYDSCSNAQNTQGLHGMRRFVEGLGMVRYYLWNVQNWSLKEMTCYRKGNEVWQSCPSLANITSVEPAESPKQFVMFPNPARETVSLQLRNAAGAHVRLLDANGSERLSMDIPAGHHESQIQVGHLPGGIYLLEACEPKGPCQAMKLVLLR